MMKLFLHSIFVLFFSIFLCQPSTFSQRQDIKFHHLNVEDGLSRSTITCIYRDSRGFMWFGTQNGLNKYDGYDFTIYQHSSNNNKSISGNWITCIAEDSENNLWIGTFSKGLNKFDRNKEEFTHFSHKENNSNSIGSNSISSIYKDTNNNLWITTFRGGVNLYQEEKNSFKTYMFDSLNVNNISGNSISSIVEDSKGNFWLANNFGYLIQFNPKNEEFKKIYYDQKYHGVTNLNFFGNQTIDSEGDIWVGTENGIYIYNVTNNVFSHLHKESGKNTISNNAVTGILEDNRNILWITTDHGGINLYNKRTKTYDYLLHKANEKTSLSNNQVICFYKDFEENYWFGNFNGGVNVYFKHKQKFQVYTQETNNKKSLSSPSVISLCEDKNGNIWIGTDGGGLNLLNPVNNRIKYFKHDPNNKNSLSGDAITAIYEDEEGYIWIGTYGAGLNLFDIKHNKFTRFLHNPEDTTSIIHNNVWDIIEDSDKNLWIGTSQGPEVYDKTNKIFKRQKINSSDNSINGVKAAMDLFNDSKQNIWIGTALYGVDMFNNEKNTIITYAHNPSNVNSLPNNRINSIFEDKMGNMWFCTFEGLSRLDTNNNSFTNFTKNDGLPDNAIQSILEDDKSNLWIGTSRGLTKFNPINKTIKNYDNSHGLPSSEFNWHTSLLSKSGKMYFGTPKGLVAFHPDSIKQNDKIPKIVFTNFYIFNKPVKTETENEVLKNHINESDSIVLSYKQSVFSIQYAALNFINPEKNQYKYILEGFDNNWHYVGNERKATYTNIDPGKYIFKVRGSNNDGVWNENGASIIIIITPPLWKTWWFRVIMLLFVLFIFYALHQFRVRNIKKQKAKLERQVDIRTNELNEVNTKLEEINEEVMQQKEEILAQNEEIVKQKEEILCRNEELNESFEEIKTKNEKLSQTMDKLKVAQRQIVQSEKMASLGVLTAGIAHEINNPINFVYTGINSLKKDFDDLQVIIKEVEKLKPGVKDFEEKLIRIKELEQEYYFEEACEAIPQTIKDISIGIERTVEIINGLKQFSRMGNEPYEPSNIHQSIDDALLLLKNKYKNQISIHRNFDTNLPLLNCNQGKLIQVFMNLIGNSIDAIEGKGEITIETKHDTKNIKVLIKDTGSGMDEKTRHKIFDPFFTTKKVGKGTGLGMAIVYGILKEHKAEIDVKSEIGKGTQFHITFPFGN